MDRAHGVVGMLRRHTGAADALLAAVLAAGFLLVPLVLAATRRAGDTLYVAITGPDVTLTIASALALTQLRRRPLFALLTTAAATVVGFAGGWQVNLAQLAVCIAIFNFSLRRPRRDAIVAVAVTSLMLVAAAIVAVPLGGQAGVPDNLLRLLTATAIAIAVQSRRATIVALEDRARRAEETREETALRRVAEDRVRIARELHDVIAHNVAVISVQAGVAEHLLERDTRAAGEALHHVRASAKAVLAELQSVLGVLRQDESDLPTAPTPGIADLDELVASFRSIGMPAVITMSLPLPRLEPPADLAAFRTVQEALTNVQKHAVGAAATVALARRGDRVEVSVTNDRPQPRQSATAALAGAQVIAPLGSGLGLLGMRERVVAAGGDLQTGPTSDGGFRVVAQLPVPQEMS
jgi:signal transduction histidine kinase